MTIERWVDVRDHPDYLISNRGRVRRKKHNIYLHGSLNRANGYLRVGVDNKRYYIHRLVVDSFFDDVDPNARIRHLDGDKTNNSLENLAW